MSQSLIGSKKIGQKKTYFQQNPTVGSPWITALLFGHLGALAEDPAPKTRGVQPKGVHRGTVLHRKDLNWQTTKGFFGVFDVLCTQISRDSF